MLLIAEPKLPEAAQIVWPTERPLEVERHLAGPASASDSRRRAHGAQCTRRSLQHREVLLQIDIEPAEVVAIAVAVVELIE